MLGTLGLHTLSFYGSESHLGYIQVYSLLRGVGLLGYVYMSHSLNSLKGVYIGGCI